MGSAVALDAVELATDENVGRSVELPKGPPVEEGTGTPVMY